MLWEESLQSFQLKATYGFGPESEAADQDTRLFSPHLPALASLIANRALIYLSDPAQEINLPELDLDPESGTVLMLPLLIRRQVIGAFLIGLQIAQNPEIDSGFDPKASQSSKGSHTKLP